MSELSDMRENLVNALGDLEMAVQDCEQLEEAPTHDEVREAEQRAATALGEVDMRLHEYITDLFNLADSTEDAAQ